MATCWHRDADLIFRMIAAALCCDMLDAAAGMGMSMGTGGTGVLMTGGTGSVRYGRFGSILSVGLARLGCSAARALARTRAAARPHVGACMWALHGEHSNASQEPSKAV